MVTCCPVPAYSLKGIRAFMEEGLARRAIVVSLDPNPRHTTDGIDIMPWRTFLEHLWANRILAG